MGFLRKVSDADIQGQKARIVNQPVLTANGATVITTMFDCSRINKKRKRDNTTLNTITRAAFNEISDDSDVSSDEGKSPQAQEPLLSEDLEHRMELGIEEQRKEHKGRRRRVFFGDIASTTRYYSATLTKEELRVLKRDLWFTKQDRLRSHADCLEILKAFRIQNVEEVTRFSAVYRTSMQIPFSQESSDYLERATVSVPLIIRGMEWGIAPKLKKRRKEHIQSVLALQKHIRDVELRQRFVSSRSLQSSRPARIMARMIGEGDATASKLGLTSTALNVTTVPMVKKKTSTEKPSLGTKLPLREHQQNSKETSNTTSDTTDANCGFPNKKRTKMGHARRRRRPVLWRK